jgi:signal peptidase I
MKGVASAMSGFADNPVLHTEAGDSSERFRQFQYTTHEVTNSAKCDLAGQVLRSFGALRLRVTGSSMLPSLWSGDLLLIERHDFARISTGDIVLYIRQGRLFVHRVVSAADESGREQLVTQGDALRAPDPPVTSAELLGKVSLVFRGGKWIAPRPRRSLGALLMAALVSRSARAAGLLSRLHSIRRIRREHEALCES